MIIFVASILEYTIIMKKIILFAVAGLIAMSFTACGPSAADVQAEKEADTLDSLTTELVKTEEEVEAKREELDAAMEDLLNEFETEE